MTLIMRFLFFGLTLIFKQKQETDEENFQKPQGDFFNPAQKTNESEKDFSAETADGTNRANRADGTGEDGLGAVSANELNEKQSHTDDFSEK